MQLEMCRATYLDHALREPGAGLDGVVQQVTGLVRRLAEELTSSTRTFRQAAE